MRNISVEAAAAFMEASAFKKSNTEVIASKDVTTLSIWGNVIAYRHNNRERTIEITNCGWQSVTTKDRLNAIPGIAIKQKLKQWFLNGELWDGNLRCTVKEMSHELIDNVDVQGIDTTDYPDFCNAYIASADYDGKPMTDKQLDEINDDGDFVYECLTRQLY